MVGFISGLLVSSMVIVNQADPTERSVCISIIKKAVEAHGGNERLSRLTCFSSKDQGVIYSLGGGPISCTCENSYQFPLKRRYTMTLQVGSHKEYVTRVLNGADAWEMQNGVVRIMSPKEVQEFSENCHFLDVTRLVPLLDDARYRLSNLGEKEVHGRVVTQVRVGSDGHKNITLMFDKASGLLVGTSEVTARADGTEYRADSWRASFRNFDGLTYPDKFKVLRDGRDYLEMRIERLSFPNKMDPAHFEKPTPPTENSGVSRP